MFFYFFIVLLVAAIAYYILTKGNKKHNASPSDGNEILMERVPKAYKQIKELIEESEEADKFSKNSTADDIESSTSENLQKINEASASPQKHKKCNVFLSSLLLRRRNDTDQTDLATLLPSEDPLPVDASTETSEGIRKNSKSTQSFEAKGCPLSPMKNVSVGKEMTINEELQSNLSGDIQSQYQDNREFGSNPTPIATGGMKAAASVVHAQMEYEEDSTHGKQITIKKTVQINEQHEIAGTAFISTKACSSLMMKL